MTPTNDAPVTVEREALAQAVAVLERLPYGDWPGPMYSGKTVAANALIRRLRTSLASAPAELPDIPEYAPDDISHLEGLASYLDGYARDKGRAVLPASKSLFEEIAKRLREYDTLRASAPAGDGVEVEDAAWAWMDGKWEVFAGRDYSADEMVDAFIAGHEAALARPRAAVGEQSREAIARIIDPVAFTTPDPDDQYDHRCGVAAYHADRRKAVQRAFDKADAIIALQSAPAKVEGE